MGLAATLSSRNAIVNLACTGEVDAAFNKLKGLRAADVKKDAALLHIKSAFEYILNANNSRAVALHKQGKAADAKQIPPLAELYLKGQPCAGLADVFYLSAINIKQLVDNNLAVAAQLDGHMTLITLLSDTGLSRAAEKHLDAALALKADDPALLFHSTLMTPVVYESAEHVRATRQLLEGRLQNLSNILNLKLPALDDFTLPPSFYLVYQGYDDKNFLTELYKNYIRAYKSLDDSASMTIGQHTRNDRIRVGFVSSHIRRHSICKLFCGIIKQLNKGREPDSTDTFDIYIFSTAPATKEDEFTAELKDGCGKVTTLGPRGVVLSSEINPSSGPAPAFVEFIRMDKSVMSNRDSVRSRYIDVLVFLDIGMDPANLMWAATRLAPIQIVTWGHPSTTGLNHIDYFISSDLFYEMSNENIAPAIQNEDKQRFRMLSSDMYSEQLVLLSSLGILFSRPSLDEITLSNLNSDVLVNRPVDFYESLKRRHSGNTDIMKLFDMKTKAGSSTTKFILCPQQLPKFHPNFDDFIRSTLEVNPNSIFVVIHDPLSKYQWQRTLKQRWALSIDRIEENQTNVPKLTDRVLWLGRLDPQEYLAVLTVGDVMVDPFPFGGGVTTMEAFAVCTPVITLPLQTVPALTAGMLTQLFDEPDNSGKVYLDLLIAKSEGELVRKVDTMLRNEDNLLWNLREAICQRVHRVFEQNGAAAEWAQIIKNVVKQQHL